MIKAIAIGSDHAGFAHKEAIKAHLLAKGIHVQDFGAYSEDSVDYPDFVRPVALSVAQGKYPFGIILGGSGNGEAMVANKVQGVRCALCWDSYTARMAKEHNDANVLSIGQRTVTKEQALSIVDTWLAATFQGGRHQRRVDKIMAHDGVAP